MEINMKIIKTSITHEDHYQGLVVIMTLEGKGSGTIFVCPLNKLERILSVVGVISYEDLVGSYCRATFSDFILREIGNIIEDKWLSLKEVNNDTKETKQE